MPVTRETLAAVQRMRDQLDSVVDAQARDLVRAWADAFDEVAPDLNAAVADALVAGERVTRAHMLRSTRLLRALAAISEQLQALAEQAGVRISGDIGQVVETAGWAQMSVIDSQLPPDFDLGSVNAWSRVDQRQIAAIVQRSTEQITSLTRPLAPDAYQAVRRELIRGVAAGSNPRATARRMVARAEGRFNGGLHRALVISRTEMLDASREASRLAQMTDENVDVLGSWEWVATLDARTCPACWAMHGTRYDVETPGPLGHQQCRCARIPRTKTWRELGFDIDEPPDLLPDAETQFAALPEADQRAILGPKRFEAWRAGDFPMDRWATRRSNAGWRDGYYVSPPPSGGRRSRRAA